MSLTQLFTGIVVAMSISYFLVRPLLWGLRERLKRETQENENYLAEYAGYVGMAEQLLYVLSWYFGYPEFIAIWLVLKATSQWRAWSDSNFALQENGNKNVVKDKDKEKYFGRARFNIYLFGTALSIVAAACGILSASLLQLGYYRHFIF